MKLNKNLKSIDNKLLAKAGEEINKSLLDKIARSAGHIRYVKIKDTILSADIKRTFKDERYNIIFAGDIVNKKILSIMEQISLPKTILAELMHMKKLQPYTYHHILVVTLLAMKLVFDKNLKNDYNPKKVAQSGLIHDIGKSRIPLKVLNKPTPLTREEYEIIKMHPIIGYILLHYYLGRDHHKYDYASFEHHERLDGSGYPRNLKRIDRYAQLIAAVDMLDALISSRPYRKSPFTLRAGLDVLALDEVKQKKLNKKIVYLLVSYSRKDRPELNRLKVSTEKRDKEPEGNAYGKIAPEK